MTMSLSFLLYIGFGLFVLILLVWGFRSFSPQASFGVKSFVEPNRSRGRLSQAQTLSDSQKRLLTFCLLPSYIRHEPLLSNKLGALSAEEVRALLQKDYEIDSRDATVAQLDYLLSGVRSTALDNDIVAQSPRVEAARTSIAEALMLSHGCLEAIDSTYAWDLGEAAEVSKLGFASGYLTEQEFHNYLEQISDAAQRFGRDWYEYTLSYLLGRTMEGHDILSIKDEAFTLFHLPKDSCALAPGLNAYTRYRFTINKDCTGMSIQKPCGGCQ